MNRYKAKANHEIRIKLSKEDYEKISEKAKHLNMPISTFLKILGLKSTLKVELGEY